MLFYFRWIIYFCGVLSFATQIDGYVCNNNQTTFVPEGTTATFQVNITGDILNKPFGFQKVLSSHMYIFSVNVTVDNQSFIQEYNHTLQHGVSISSQLYSDNLLGIRFDLYNVSMQDNGTYVLYSQTRTCFTVFIMQITIAPIDFQEENEPVNVYVHPHASLIRRLLENVSMVVLIDGLSVDETTTCIQQDDLFWISSVIKGLHGKNITYRALLNDGIAIEINKTLNVRYGPSFPVTLIPRKIHYNLVSDDIMPDVTCTSECNPSCNISWGKHGIGAILRLGRVSTTSTGEYTCTVSRYGGRTINQTISIFVIDNSFNDIAIVCLIAIQGLTISIAVGVCAYILHNKNGFARTTSSQSKVKTIIPTVQVQRKETYEIVNFERRGASGVYDKADLERDGTQSSSSIYNNTMI